MPTWGWGSTRLCVHNYGSIWGQAQLQAGVAAPDTLNISPYGTSCESRWWFGVPVRVTNTGWTPLGASGS